MVTKIALDMADFQCLVRGGQLDLVNEKGDLVVSMVLKDIGFVNMYEAIERVENAEENPYEGLSRPLK